MQAGVNRRLLAQLACTPDPHVCMDWAREHTRRVTGIRTYLRGANARNETAVTIEAVCTWRVSLDDSLIRLGEDLDHWDCWCHPGTWLDSHLRLRALLAQLLVRWDGLALVPYADMNVADFLWGVCPHRTSLAAASNHSEPENA